MEADSRESEHGEARSSSPKTPLTSSKSSVPVREQPALLRLSLELREMIYQHLLLIGVVRICTVTWDNRTRYPPKYRRSTFKSKYDTAEGTYALISPHDSDLPFLAILETCKDIYRDSASYFYSKNAFSFDCIEQDLSRDELDFYIRTALAFLQDRPSCILGWMKHIKIGFGPENTSCRSSRLRTLFHNAAPLEEVERFYAILRNQLKLKKLSITVRGWPLDVRPGRLGFEYRPESTEFNQGRRDVDPWTSKHVRIGLKHLLSLCDIPRVSVEIHAKQPSNHGTPQTESFDPGRLVAFAALLRSRLLKGGEALGTANISVHKRHLAEVAFPVDMPNDSVFRRHRERYWVVRCDDEQSGKSLLAPAKRLQRPLVRDPNRSEQLLQPFYNSNGELHNHSIYGREHKYLFDRHVSLEQILFSGDNSSGPPSFSNFLLSSSDSPSDHDYNDSDDGENDSLKDVDLSAEDVEHLPPEAFM